MENLMVTLHEASAAVCCGIGYPKFSLSGSEAQLILDACERAGIKGPLMDKIKTIANYAAAKEGYTGRQALIKME